MTHVGREQAVQLEVADENRVRSDFDPRISFDRRTRDLSIGDVGHTAGLRTHPSEYERRTTTFLDRALGLTETP